MPEVTTSLFLVGWRQGPWISSSAASSFPVSRDEDQAAF